MVNHPYSPNCACPGCQYTWAVDETIRQHGMAPVIGTFEPVLGDVGRLDDTPNSLVGIWTGSSAGWMFS